MNHGTDLTRAMAQAVVRLSSRITTLEDRLEDALKQAAHLRSVAESLSSIFLGAQRA